MLVEGYFRVGRLAGVDYRLHWSVPVGALVFGSLRFEPILWLAFMGVIVVHELGHASCVKSAGFRVIGIDLTGFGGQCRWRGSANSLEHAVIAWGGVAAQVVLLLSTLAFSWVAGAPTSQWGVLVHYAFVEINLWVILMNLLPFPPLDGARAWRLFPELRARGWTVWGLVLHPLTRWAERRRRVRRGEPEPEELGALESQSPDVRRRPTRLASKTEPVVADPPGADDAGAKPSAQAQRELAALLERIGDEAGRARRRR